MADALIICTRHTLPDGILGLILDHLDHLEHGDYESVLKHDLNKQLLGFEESDNLEKFEFDSKTTWNNCITKRLDSLLSSDRKDFTKGESLASDEHVFFIIAIAALQAFLQSNFTGPPLPFNSAETLFPPQISNDPDPARVACIRRDILSSLSVDGEAAYKLTPNIELFVLAKVLLSRLTHVKVIEWAQLRLDVVHQHLLSEKSPSLQESVYEKIAAVEQLVPSLVSFNDPTILGQFMLEKAAVHNQFGLDKKARDELVQAAKFRKFDFALTGRLGKRTKYQERDTSQLVVLARSYDRESRTNTPLQTNGVAGNQAGGIAETKPQTLDLNDDTLLEQISFADRASSADVTDEADLPESLSSLEAGSQPILDPLDSIHLLLLASSITNRSPTDGLTREETLPYATRVLEGGSSNWQIYTQALLVRSRIEGYRSRTIERGLLQLQALVDQVIAETTQNNDNSEIKDPGTFLPRPKESESAPISERLRYIYSLSSPARWELEAELAARWVTLGGLRSALSIYERLEMWPEAALCWAATEREDKAKKIVRRQLFHASGGKETTDEEEKWEGIARDPPPADAPRLYCILGDFDHDTTMFEKAWEVSHCRYARAQRSLGRHYFQTHEFSKSAQAYHKAIKVSQLDHATWFAYGCVLLELAQFEEAASAFSRTVQIDDSDAEAWSNLAAALLRKGQADAKDSEVKLQNETQRDDEDEEDVTVTKRRQDPQQHQREALNALKRASTLKFDNYRIWDNLLTVAATLSPPAFTDIVVAQRRIIEMRGSSDGEKCVDEDILDALVRHVTSITDVYEPGRPGLARFVVELVDAHVVPLITTSPRLWHIVARLALWRRKPTAALEAHEKAWRAATSMHAGWEAGTEEGPWNDVVDATIDLVGAYESLGEMEKTDGLAAGSGELVAKNWRFKASRAVRNVMGRGKGSWDGTNGWERLQTSLEDLKDSK